MGNYWLLFVFLLMGAAGWLVEHHAQKESSHRGTTVRPPRWLAWLCGDPRRDGTVDLDSALRQFASLAFVVGGPVAYLLRLDLARQAAYVFLAYALISAPAVVLGEWLRWRQGRAVAANLEGEVRKPRPWALH